MKLVNERYEAFVPKEDEYFFTYNFQQNDIMLDRLVVIEELKTPVYKVLFGGICVDIPETYNIIIADRYHNMVDSVTPDEVIGRPDKFETPVWCNRLEKYRMVELDIVGYENDKKFIVPYSDKPFFILIGTNSYIMVSSRDLNHQLSKLNFSDIMVAV